MNTQLGGRRLYRSRRDRLLFGVCSGLADYFDIDPTLARLVFVLITLAGGAGILVYIILAIIIPEEGTLHLGGQAGLRQNVDSLVDNTGEVADQLRSRMSGQSAATTADADRPKRSQTVIGMILIGLGILFVASNLGWLVWFSWHNFWPLILIAIGVAILLRRDRSSRASVDDGGRAYPSPAPVDEASPPTGVNELPGPVDRQNPAL